MSQLFWRTARGWIGRSGTVQEKSACIGPGGLRAQSVGTRRGWGWRRNRSGRAQ